MASHGSQSDPLSSLSATLQTLYADSDKTYYLSAGASVSLTAKTTYPSYTCSTVLDESSSVSSAFTVSSGSVTGTMPDSGQYRAICTYKANYISTGVVFTITLVVASGSDSYTIEASTTGSGGSISPSGSVSVASGENQTFTISTNTGYYIYAVYVDGNTQTVPSRATSYTYTFENVTANHTITAMFYGLTYTIVASAGTGGSISPSGYVYVSPNSSKAFTITSSTGYCINTITVDGTGITTYFGDSTATYTFSTVTSNHTISVSFYYKGGGGGGGGSSETGENSTYNTYVPDPVTSSDPYSGGSSTSGDTNCYLTRQFDGTTSTFYLPFVQSIEETDSATITEISTIVMGYENNFAMDTGTTQKLTVSLRRPQPASPNDSSSDQSKWTNGYWVDQLRDFTDRWQNLYKNMSGESTGGFVFYFKPYSESYRSGVSYTDLFPTLTLNVFLSGQVTVRNSPDNLKYIDVSIPLTTASMVETTPVVETVTVTFAPNGPSGASSYSTEFPANAESTVPSPTEWDEYIAAAGYAFDYWTDSDGTQYYAGGTFTPTADMTMTANWATPYGWVAYDGLDEAEDYIVSVPSDATAVSYFLIGPGGDGGKGYQRSGGSEINPYTLVYFGGGGGSGAYVSGSLSVSSGTLTLHVTSSETALYYNDTKIIKAAKGGSGGNATSSSSGSAGAAGSPNGYAGNSTTEGGKYYNSSAWIYVAPEVAGAAQKKLSDSFSDAGGPYTSVGQEYTTFASIKNEAAYGGGGSGWCSDSTYKEGALGLAVVAFRK